MDRRPLGSIDPNSIRETELHTECRRRRDRESLYSPQHDRERDAARQRAGATRRLSLIHISEPTRQEAISYAVFCLKKKTDRLCVLLDVRLILVLVLGRQIVYGQNTVYLCLSRLKTYLVFENTHTHIATAASETEGVAAVSCMESHMNRRTLGSIDPNSIRQTELHTECRRRRETESLYSPCLLYTSPSPRDKRQSRMPSSA